MLVQLDFNIEDAKAGFDPLPVGAYPAKITKAELDISSTGKPMIKVQWTVTEGEFEGRIVFDNIVTSVQFKVKQYCDVAGISSGQTFDTADFLGCVGILHLTQEQYQGDIQNKIKNIDKAQ